MKNQVKRMTLVAFVLAMAVVTTVSASNLSFDFEAPTYVVGDIQGQDGWYITGTVYSERGVIDSTIRTPLSGSQSLRLWGSGFARHSLASQTFADGVELSVLLQAEGDYSTITLNNTVGGGQTFANVEFNCGGLIYASSETTGQTYTAQDVYKATMVLDFTNQQYNVRLTNLTAGTAEVDTGWYAFTDTTAAIDAGGEVLLRMRSDGLFDDVEFVPEPATIALLALGGFVIRKQRKAVK